MPPLQVEKRRVFNKLTFRRSRDMVCTNGGVRH
jgi:hypothetical protein